jgi:hypothetical protein
MPAWTTTALDDGQTRHELDGDRFRAMVLVDPAIRRTVISVAIVVLGTDEATVQRCKDRAERLLIEVQR